MNRQNEEESMTTAEAGRKGVETLRKKYGPDAMEKIGHKGGQRVRELVEEGEEMETGGGR